MIKKLNEYKALIGLVGLIAAGILWFTPMSYSKQTREMVVEMGIEDQLQYYQKQRLWYKRECTNLKTSKWLCGDEEKLEYEDILFQIKLLKEKLGIKEEAT